MPCPLCGKTIGHKKWCASYIDNDNDYGKLKSKPFNPIDDYLKKPYKFEDPLKTLRKDPPIIDPLPGPEPLDISIAKPLNIPEYATGKWEYQLGYNDTVRVTQSGTIENSMGAIVGKIDDNRNIFDSYGKHLGSVNEAGQILDKNGIPTGKFDFKP